ncbi:receptor like protein 52 [Artemisia annua]|uniref:Receptor like protein 52 n=1 Tax=Artemisia annua TaxID=35608 RepID=A0A2U1Q363_ARTAN|nr:receptor like protein 52 [Artemisia annua]
MSNSKLFNSVILSCFFIAFASCTSPTTRKCSAQQARALLLFKESLFSINDTSSHTICEDVFPSENFPKLMNWNISSDCCNWDGVKCKHTTGDIIGLNLRCGMLQGNIHANSTLFNLPHLETLDMALNNLTLEPRALINLFQNCTNLKELSLRRVNISSGLPSNLNISSSLKKINLRSTSMHGKLPHNLFNLQSLEELNLSDNNFTGQIPSEISHLPKLSLLDLSNNIGIDLPPYILNNLLLNSTLLTNLWLAEINIGLVLPTYLNISSSLKSLDLTSTGLQGKVPDNIFNLKYLEELVLSGNSDLTGPMPIVNTSTSIDLKWLDLSLTNLSGELPYSIGHLKSLVFLSFSDCGLMGPLPESLVNLRQLVFLYLSSNMLSGVLPTRLFTLPSLEYVRLSRNMLNGTIPLELFSLQSIKGLSLGHNQLSGKIDVLGNVPVAQTFQKLTNLTYLDLSSNNFRGDWELDTLLSSLTDLRELHLSRSGLSVMTKNATSYVNPDFKILGLAYCKIKVFPKSLRAMKKLQSLDISNNDIHGHIPDWVGEIGGNRLLLLDLSNNSIAGTIPNDGPRVLHLAWESIQVSRMVHVVDIRWWRQKTTLGVPYLASLDAWKDPRMIAALPGSPFYKRHHLACLLRGVVA